MLRASGEDDGVRQGWMARRCQPSCAFCLAREEVAVELVVVAEDRCEVVDPFVGWGSVPLRSECRAGGVVGGRVSSR